MIWVLLGTQNKPFNRILNAVEKEINEVFGSVENFEDKYEFDMAHIFGGPDAFKRDLLDKIKSENEEFTPDLLINEDIFTNPDNIEDYKNIN